MGTWRQESLVSSQNTQEHSGLLWFLRSPKNEGKKVWKMKEYGDIFQESGSGKQPFRLNLGRDNKELLEGFNR